MKKQTLPSLRFVKNYPNVYFQLLRLARISLRDSSLASNNIYSIKLLNQLPSYFNEHKRIIPLLCSKAKQLDIFGQLSSESQNLLTMVTHQAVITELAQAQQLNCLISVLAKEEIPIILLKGAAFNGTLYSSQAPRMSNDLDLLIRAKDWNKAVSSIKQVMSYTQKRRTDVFGDLYEISFSPNTKTGAALDLHSSFTHPVLFCICEKKLWGESLPHPKYNNSLVRILSPEHALIHQAIHAFKDMDFCKYNLMDSHEIISQQHPDINSTIDTAKEWGVELPLFTLLNNCNEIMNSAVPDNALNRIKPNIITSIIMSRLLKSRFTQPSRDRKSFRYRLNQIISQFVFTRSLKRPVLLQLMFIKMFLFSVANSKD